MSRPPALDAAQRGRLERLVGTARRMLEEDLASQAEGRYGIHVDGRVEDEAALRLDPTATEHRRTLTEIVAHLRAAGEGPRGAAARLLREAAFTHLNRLVAIRVAEAAGLVPESLARGDQSSGFRQLAELAPQVADDYWGYLRLVGDELAADAPALFDPRNPLLQLAPTRTCADGLVRLFTDPTDAGLWEAADTLGWAYQFFNTRDERQAMRDASAAPRDSRELAVRNQFFTPHYVVDFLVQNTLGRRLLEADPKSPLREELRLLVDPPDSAGPPLELDQIRILDPACGSGHFLLGCYDLLERAWALHGVDPAEAAPRIVAALWGVDIDPRCAQVTSAAVMLRARRHHHDLRVALPKPNVACARPLPIPDAGHARLDPELRRLVDAIAGTLEDAALLGVLLKLEEHLDDQLNGMVFGTGQGVLSVASHVYEDMERRLLAALQELADEAGATVSDQLFVAEANDAVRLVDICRSRFDVVLMNPPFGEPAVRTKSYLRTAYPWLPTKDSNLLAAFVGRGLQLCKSDGYLGAITSRAGLFLTTFADWRTEALLENRLTVLADLGFGVMEQAVVEAAAYVIGPGRPDPNHTATFIRLLKETDRPAALTTAAMAARNGGKDHRVFRAPVSELGAIPGSPVAYWMSSSLRRLFTDLPPIEGTAADVRQGLATGDDFRFVRAFWEIDPRRIARSRDETRRQKRWCPFAKGGEYSPYWSDIHLVVDYEDDGRPLRQYEGSVIRNPQYYFRPGLTWPRRTQAGFGPRILPAGCVFGDKGPALFPKGTDATEGRLQEPEYAAELLGWLQCRASMALLDAMATFGAYEVGLVQRLPWPGAGSIGTESKLAAQARDIAAIRANGDRFDETARRFAAPAILEAGSVRAGVKLQQRRFEAGALHAIRASAELDELWCRQLGLDDADRRYLDKEIGTHPATIVEAQRWLGGPPPEEPRAAAEDLVSYLFGCAMGRWDVRIGRDPSLAPPTPDLFDPVPLCPPGMLLGSDGFPAVGPPDGYPLELPPNRLLVDEPGHPWDVEARLVRAAEALFDEPMQVVGEALEVLGRRSLREYLRRDFFKAHLRRYTKSRRKAPIYWLLAPRKTAWGTWVYAPTLTREAIYAVAHEARQRERLAGDAVGRLEEENARGGDGRPLRAVAGELDAETRLAEQLRVFRIEAERIAQLGWAPDLDDGLVLCAAPLANLLSGWPDPARERGKIRAGAYPWSTVSRWMDAI